MPPPMSGEASSDLSESDCEGQQHGWRWRAGVGVACRGKAHRCASGTSCLIPTPGAKAGTKDMGGPSSTRLHAALPSGWADLRLGSRGGRPMSSGPLLPQGLSRAPALPTWHLQRPHEARLRGRVTPVPGGGWLWGGPCLYLAPKVEGCHRVWRTEPSGHSRREALPSPT